MNTSKCPNCGYENRNTNIRCESCGKELNNTKYTKYSEEYCQTDYKSIALAKKKINRVCNIILILILIPWFLGGLVFIGIYLYLNITNNNKAKNYFKTDAKLIKYDCFYDEEGNECSAIYEYIVDGVTYRVSPNVISNSSGFKQTTMVRYNPDNPNEYVIDFDWSYLLITGIIIDSIVTLIFIILKKSINKKLDKIYNMQKDN